jgi:hypothetical protein
MFSHCSKTPKCILNVESICTSPSPFLKFIRHKIFSSKHALQKFHVLVNGEKFDEKYDSFMNNVYQNK